MRVEPAGSTPVEKLYFRKADTLREKIKTISQESVVLVPIPSARRISQSDLNGIIDSNKDYKTYTTNCERHEKIYDVQINSLSSKELSTPLTITLELDDGGFLAKMKEIPLFGFGDIPREAIDNLQYEIESLYEDLLEDNNFSQEWLEHKDFLSEIISD